MSEVPEDCSCLYCRVHREVEAELAGNPGSGPGILDTLVMMTTDLLAACHDPALRDCLFEVTKHRLLDEHMRRAMAAKSDRRVH